MIEGYTDLTEVGRGAVGVVYRARDEKLKRIVALKVMHAELGSDEDLADRFRGEVAQAQLDVPQVVKLNRAGVSNGRLFVDMEFVAGVTLADKIKSGLIPHADVVAIAREVLIGLAAANERGIVHGDIKPGNIMIADDGSVKITDFGLAQLLRPDDGATVSFDTLGGSPLYMSPEGIFHADHRSDVYALGLTLYEMVAGRLPFDAGAKSAEIFHAKRNDLLPELKSVAASVPANLNDVVLRAIASKPEDRFQTAGEMLAALDALDAPDAPDALERANQGPTVLERRPANVFMPAIAAAVVVVVAIAAFFGVKDLISEKSRPTVAERDTTAAPDQTALAEEILIDSSASTQPALRRAQPPPESGDRGRLAVSVVPAGVISVDNEPYSEGEATVTAGSHSVRCERNGFRADTTVMVGNGAVVSLTCYTELRVNLVTRTADDESVWATIWVNGENTNTTSDRSFVLPVGDHEVFARRQGYATVTDAVRVAVRPSFSPRAQRLLFVLEQ